MPAAKFTSIGYGERLAEIGAQPSIGSVGDSYDTRWRCAVDGLSEQLHRSVALQPVHRHDRPRKVSPRIGAQAATAAELANDLAFAIRNLIGFAL
jgi:hypothetical protein